MSRSVRWLGAAAVAVALVVIGGATGAGSAPPTGAALAALSQPPRYSSLASQRIYFVLPDRYANGDTSNDRGGLSGNSRATGFEPADPGFWHGGDFKGLTGNCTDTKAGLARLSRSETPFLLVYDNVDEPETV